MNDFFNKNKIWSFGVKIQLCMHSKRRMEANIYWHLCSQHILSTDVIVCTNWLGRPNILPDYNSSYNSSMVELHILVRNNIERERERERESLPQTNIILLTWYIDPYPAAYLPIFRVETSILPNSSGCAEDWRGDLPIIFFPPCRRVNRAKHQIHMHSGCWNVNKIP